MTIKEHKRFSPEFFVWAREHGWPSRGPKGSVVNMERAKMLPKLYSLWLKEQEEGQHGREGPAEEGR
jgi:hypothetical protein